MTRESGVLLPVSSLPSRYGIGCFSREAYEFVDQLKAAGQKKWQILPLGPTSYGDSPYQSFSTFAGNPYYIDLEKLINGGLLTREECDAVDFGDDPQYVDYEKMYFGRFKLLRKAFHRFQSKGHEEYAAFVSKNGFWLEDYCLYMVLKDKNGGVSWTEWDEVYRDRHPGPLQEIREELEEEVLFYRFQQYLFWRQWRDLHEYANAKGIQIVGDIPIYVAFDSADTWARPQMFQFTEANEPAAVAGCPPDGFSATGQLWGNPLYRWEYHRETGYAWWLQRIEYCMQMYDIVRIDHFRGFDEYYSIPYGDKSAEFGHWEKGPGIELFTLIKERLGEVNVIAEDLGYLTDTVRELVRKTGYPGMKVLEFAFDSDHTNDYLPHNYGHNSVVYTGTHDNDTVRGWYSTLNKYAKGYCNKYIGGSEDKDETIHWDLIRMAMASTADLCIVPIQDYLGLGKEARFNFPSTIGDNWKWRLLPGQITTKLLGQMCEITGIYGR
ncbi:4-alpha-glucanotransferase [Hespellia stercorisuis]|uniref:4-alpha-glucanotransferase n=1 Tax=Hespellia stercorisuis DSM 15480 TaxID=1121950 RepID=A0A1M6R3F7_9FIRM|nr:4-alpha-glucanotransferase [Hespellia stercorisuis]SHK27009.1 4-alpha-glucanotransferase [Hespellia stercorisuis DSM 15480]